MTLFETSALQTVPALQQSDKNVETGRRRPAFLGLTLKR